jgi:hypothetical protein
MTLASASNSCFTCGMMVQTRVHRVTRRPMAKSMPPLQLLLGNHFCAIRHSMTLELAMQME